MEDRRAKSGEPKSEPPPGLEEVYCQLDGRAWEERGSGGVVHRRDGLPVYFDKEQLDRLKIHNGNRYEIAEIMKEARCQNAARPKRSAP